MPTQTCPEWDDWTVADVRYFRGTGVLALGSLLSISLFTFLITSYFGVFARWEYFGGYISPHVEAWRLLGGLVASGILGAFIPLQRSWFSQVGLAVALALIILPGIAIAAVTDGYQLFLRMVGAASIFIGIYTIINASSWSVIPKHLMVSASRIKNLLIIIGLPAVLFVFYSFDLKFPHSLILDVYDIRVQMREESASRLAGYTYGMTAKLLVAAAVAWATVYRSVVGLALACIFVLAIFFIGAHKSVVGVALVAAVVAHWGRRIQRHHGIVILMAVLAGSVVIWLFSLLIDSFVLHDLLLRRVMHLPGVLTVHYFSYFESIPNLLSGGVVPSEELPFVIGAEIFGREQMRANVNGYANAYAQLGFVGISFFSVAYSLVTKFLSSAVNACYDHRARRFVLAVAMVYLWVLSESAITTTLATHGLGLFFIIIILSLVPIRNRSHG